MDAFQLVEEEKVIQRIKDGSGTQKALAKQLDIGPSLLNAYFNKKSPMPWSIAAMLEVITARKWGYDQRVTPYQMMSFIKAKDRAALIAQAKMQARANVTQLGLSLGDRALLVDHIRTYMHGGRRKKSESQDRNCDLESAIKQAGLSSRDQYYRIKQVLINGCPELIAAMNTGNISITMAASLSILPVEQQRMLVQLKHRDLMVAVKALKKR